MIEAAINGVEMSQADRAAHFRRLHETRPLVLPNAWDAASARVIELAGAPAIASTSAGVAWAHGRPDGQKLDRREMIEAIRRIVQAVTVPVTADIEGGYGSGFRGGCRGHQPRGFPGLGRAGAAGPGTAGRADPSRADSGASDGDRPGDQRAHRCLSHAGRSVGSAVRRDRAPCQALLRGRSRLPVRAGRDRCRYDRGAGRGDRRTPEYHGRSGRADHEAAGAITLAALAATQRAARELLERGNYGELGDAMPFGEANGMFTS